MSPYMQLIAEIESRKCQTCSGLGECNDAGLGDIWYNRWQCGDCKGTGFQNGQAYQATPISGGDVR